MANDVKNTSSKVYRLLSDRCSLRVESAANPLRCCLSWRRACEVRRGGPAGRVRGHRMTGGTPKEVHWTAEQQKRPQRTYRGRKRRETAAQGLDHWACFRPQNVVFVNPPKDLGGIQLRYQFSVSYPLSSVFTHSVRPQPLLRLGCRPRRLAPSMGKGRPGIVLRPTCRGHDGRIVAASSFFSAGHERMSS